MGCLVLDKKDVLIADLSELRRIGCEFGCDEEIRIKKNINEEMWQEF